MTKTIPALCSKYLNTVEDFKQAINTFIIHPTMEFIMIEAILQYIPREKPSEKKIRSRLWFIDNFNPPELIYILGTLLTITLPLQLQFSRKKLVQPPTALHCTQHIIIFEEKITNFKAHLPQRGYPEDLINTTLSEVNFKDRKLALQQKPKTNLRILPFVTQYQPSVPHLKQILMKNWHLIEQQPLLSEIYKKPPLVSYKRGRSLKDILVRAKL